MAYNLADFLQVKGISIGNLLDKVLKAPVLLKTDDTTMVIYITPGHVIPDDEYETAEAYLKRQGVTIGSLLDHLHEATTTFINIPEEGRFLINLDNFPRSQDSKESTENGGLGGEIVEHNQQSEALIPSSPSIRSGPYSPASPLNKSVDLTGQTAPMPTLNQLSDGRTFSNKMMQPHPQLDLNTILETLGADYPKVAEASATLAMHNPEYLTRSNNESNSDIRQDQNTVESQPLTLAHEGMELKIVSRGSTEYAGSEAGSLKDSDILLLPEFDSMSEPPHPEDDVQEASEKRPESPRYSPSPSPSPYETQIIHPLATFYNPVLADWDNTSCGSLESPAVPLVPQSPVYSPPSPTDFQHFPVPDSQYHADGMSPSSHSPLPLDTATLAKFEAQCPESSPESPSSRAPLSYSESTNSLGYVVPASLIRQDATIGQEPTVLDSTNSCPAFQTQRIHCGSSKRGCPFDDDDDDDERPWKYPRYSPTSSSTLGRRQKRSTRVRSRSPRELEQVTMLGPGIGGEGLAVQGSSEQLRVGIR